MNINGQSITFLASKNRINAHKKINIAPFEGPYGEPERGGE
jgi:hypothetical protein